MIVGLFRKKRETEPAPQPEHPDVRGQVPATPVPNCAPGTEIRYHPDLIARFRGHHASLRKLFDATRNHAENDEFAAALKSLKSFRQVLTTHLLEENINLYTYLSKCLARDPDSKELITGMKSEMGQIGRSVMRFMQEYTNAGITPFNKKRFLDELTEMGKLFADRLEREETSLYTLYMPVDAFR